MSELSNRAGKKKVKNNGPRVVPQVDASLDKPLDKDAPPTIFQKNLTPEYASAALNLSIDFLKQQQSMANKYLIVHPLTISSIALFLIIFLTPRLVYPSTAPFSSVSTYLLQFIKVNQREVLGALLFTIILTSFLFTFLSRISDHFFKSKIRHIVQKDGEPVFNLNLKSEIPENGSADTNIIIYRGTPISLISVSENNVLSSLDSLVMNINTIGCRQVYTRSGILEDLIDWAMIRTKQVGVTRNKTNKSMKLIIEVYSFDETLKKILQKKGFKLVSKGKLNENRLLGGLFGVKRELWGVQFHIQPRSTQKA
ncbi:hypothetical protein KAFR_0D02760 [Kazachstania africana CBS 2517]|uniref:Inorganic phosphate transporter PHO86 n=1 Tax=Kazachstania africana (strain ATCC 22294 / BCRC 22015 / CBS 2517 / CECT 1963 / NBRC 1671 / NRRL Y-8276) TaxID=1071382 RepID=H2AU74_KAZAF|nr:hypothetical protein KAFR_0D02760 [Kazachstania africana CBS 2517]CCF57924.1 hypothetical protein KAFR_0D02760 [Kazachstania africana CBS 2517]